MIDRRHAPRSIPAGLALPFCCAALTLFVVLSCATARLDPNRNQALTFDTVPASDAGEPATISNSPAVRVGPSQPAANESPAPPKNGDAGAGPEPLTCTVDPPDPKPSNTREWIVYEFEYNQGKVNPISQRRERLAKPRDTSRVMGRYAIELWIGCELVDRVRFSFPLQAADTPKPESARHPLHEQPSLTAHAQLRATVRVPLELRATRAELVDHGAGKRQALSWPPNLQATGTENPKSSDTAAAGAPPATGSQPAAAKP